ncbi:MAG: hypothetical protein J6P78_00560 [Lachnospiraceae bacterium]|nr:hypothetical protein [Lachnospiraceae bacterium]MBP5655446.1 hypothetical protein [Clostridiales bacterium]
MGKMKKIMTAVLAATLFTFALTGCFSNNKRGPLDVKKVSYLISYEDIGHDLYYVITDDYKVTKYSIFPEARQHIEQALNNAGT